MNSIEVEHNLIKECDQRHLEIDKHYKERREDLDE